MYDHVWHWHSRLPERKGTACRVVARSRRLGQIRSLACVGHDSSLLRELAGPDLDG